MTIAGHGIVEADTGICVAVARSLRCANTRLRVAIGDGPRRFSTRLCAMVIVSFNAIDLLSCTFSRTKDRAPDTRLCAEIVVSRFTQTCI